MEQLHQTCQLLRLSLCGYRNRATNAFAFDLQAACSSFCMECLLPQLMFNLENIKGFTDRADKMSSIVDYTDRSLVYFLEMVQGSIV
jgi:hypothetical protein